MARGWLSAGCRVFDGVGDDVKLEKKIESAIYAAFDLVDTDYEKLADDAQLINGEWYNPTWGCDTMQHFIDALEAQNEKSPKKGLDPNS